MKSLLVTWLAEWAASPLTTTPVLSSWNMVFTQVPVTESVDDVDLLCPSAAIPMLHLRCLLFLVLFQIQRKPQRGRGR